MFAFAQNVSIELFFGKKLINWNLIRFRSLIKPEMTIIVIIITIKSSGTSVNKNFYEKKNNYFAIIFLWDSRWVS